MMNEEEKKFQLAIQCFLKKDNKRGDKANLKALREEKKNAKAFIVQQMVKMEMQSVPISENRYLCLTKKIVMPPINEEFLYKAFFTFSSNPKHLKGTKEEVSKRFVQYIKALRKHLAKSERDLKVSRKEPIDIAKILRLAGTTDMISAE